MIEEEQKLCEMKTKRHAERIKLLHYIDTIPDTELAEYTARTDYNR